jgi:hypothetical protein
VRDSRTDIVNEIAGQYMDVLSINYYCFNFEKDFLINAHKKSGKPFILSEWSYDTQEQGLMVSLRNVENQTQRGKAYRNYVEQAASLPFIVGVQWWCMLDHQSMKVNTGLVNVADRPYNDFLNEVVKTNHKIYSLVLGERTPFEFKEQALFSEAKKNFLKIADVPHALPGMKVDGVQNPWPNRPSYRITAQSFVFGKNPGETEADFWLCWDEKSLYLYIDVKDSTPRLSRISANEKRALRGIWRDDAVELYLGQITDKSGLVFTDRQILISAGRNEPAEYYWYNSPKQFETEVVVKDSGGQGYVIEAGIPFEALGIKPEAGVEFMFDLAVDDSEGHERARQFMWNGTSDNSMDHKYWGRARLSD